MKKLHYVMGAAMLLGAHTVLAQATVGTANTPVTPPAGHGSGKQAQSTKSKATQALAQNTPSCQSIISECKTLGFIVGQWKKDNGLWKDCFDPVVKGGSATKDGKPITVPVSASNVQACHAAVFGAGKPNS